MKRDILRWCRTCLACQKAKVSRHNKRAPGKFDMPEHRFDHVHMDLIILPNVNNFRYCLTMMDRFSRWPEAIPLKDISADTVATAFYTHWIARFGCPKTITTDQGTQFESALFRSLTNLVGAKRIHTTPYHPCSNGLIERWHRALKSSLMCHTGSSWVELLPTVLIGLRTCYKEDIQASAAEMLYGTTLRVPGEFFLNEDLPTDTQVFLEKFRQHMRLIRPIPTAHHYKPKIFQFKDLFNCSHVFLRTDSVKKPLENPYSGPYQVVERRNDVFTILINNERVNISIDRLKPAYRIQEDLTQSTNAPVVEPTPLRTYRGPKKKKVSFFELPAGQS
ncbi:hypothetical protein ABEB36_003876 [Hypothenemus hampei]|uniref:Integrase catalytic domain-containing protein n=1 Tax=Hypothenemus hampei TaxID=57062 RepID=A0ABD1F1E9_HYPHA